MSRKILIAIAFIILAALIIIFIKPVPEGGVNGEVSILQEFEDKIVYTTNISLDKTPFVKDCEERYGDFNECGTVCEPDADICANVCAYTCEF